MENPRGDTRHGWAGGYEAEAWRAGALCAMFNLLKCMVSSLLSALISLPQKKKKSSAVGTFYKVFLFGSCMWYFSL